MDSPLVSIYITSYNQERSITATVLSAVNQDYENLEVVVSDDCSTDNSPTILDNLAAQYPHRLEIIHNKENVGSVKNHSIALDHCRGKYVASLDGDDLYLPGKIRKQVEFMETQSDCVISYHNCEVVDVDSQNILYLWADRFGRKEGGVESLIRHGIFMASPTVMVRKEFIPADKNIREIFIVGSDWFLWIQTLAKIKGTIRYLDEILAKYHRHNSNITLDWEAKLESRFKTLDLVEKQYPDLSCHARKYRSDLYLIQAIIWFSRYEYLSFGQAIFQSIYFSLPEFWNILRLPIREFSFYLRRGMKADDLIYSLITPKTFSVKKKR